MEQGQYCEAGKPVESCVICPGHTLLGGYLLMRHCACFESCISKESMAHTVRAWQCIPGLPELSEL